MTCDPQKPIRYVEYRCITTPSIITAGSLHREWHGDIDLRLLQSIWQARLHSPDLAKEYWKTNPQLRRVPINGSWLPDFPEGARAHFSCAAANGSVDDPIVGVRLNVEFNDEALRAFRQAVDHATPNTDLPWTLENVVVSIATQSPVANVLMAYLGGRDTYAPKPAAFEDEASVLMDAGEKLWVVWYAILEELGNKYEDFARTQFPRRDRQLWAATHLPFGLPTSLRTARKITSGFGVGYVGGG